MHLGDTFDSSPDESLLAMKKTLARETAALKEHRTLLKVFDQLVKQPNLETAFSCLLDQISILFQLQASLIVAHDKAKDAPRLLAQTGTFQIDPQDFNVPKNYFHRPRKLINAAELGEKIHALGIRSAMIVPLDIPNFEKHFVICLSEAKEAFTSKDIKYLHALAKISAQPLANHLLTRRNEQLAALVRGNPQSNEGKPAVNSVDLAFQSVSHAIGRLTHAQEMMVGVLNDILMARVGDLDRRLADCLARICAHTGADRAQIGLLTPDGAFRSEIRWANPDCEPCSRSDDGYWDIIVPSARTQLSMGHPALLRRNDADPDHVLSDPAAPVSVALLPIVDQGRLIGVLGVDHVTDNHFFLPGMVFLLQSIAHAIGAVYRQSRIEAKTVEAQTSLWLERRRLKATLSALPDLVIEVDDTGRFTAHHSQQNETLVAVMKGLLGRTMEEALPDHLVALGRHMLQTVAASGKAECAPFQYDLGDGDIRWVTATAVRRDGITSDGEEHAVTLFVLRDVTTEVTQAEEISRLSQVARRTQNYVIMADADRRITWVNRAFEIATGWQLSEIRGLVPSDFLLAHNTDRDRVEAVNKELALGRAVQIEARGLTKDGRTFWVSSDIQPIFDGGGQLSGYVSVQTDITQRREHESVLAEAAQQAREARAFLLTAIESLQDGFVVFDRDGKLVLCNEKYRYVYPGMEDVMVPGTTRDQILDHALALGALSIPEGGTRAQLFEKMFGRAGEDTVQEIMLPNGRWLRIDNKQTPDGSWVGLRVDITTLKEAEAGAMQDRQSAMDAAQDGMARINITGEVVYANKTFATMFNLDDKHPVEGQPWAKIMGPAVADVVAKEAIPSLQAGAPNWHGIVRLPPGAGTLAQIEISITPNPDGTSIWVVRDLSERLQHEEERMKLTEELQLAQRREVIGQLAAGLAHDFNNLLAAISGSALLIKEDQPRNSPEWSHAERILKSTGQAEAMVRRLLALGARPTHHQKINLGPVIHEAAEMLRPALSRSIKLDVDVADMPIFVDVESTDILQIILNIGVNARDALLVRQRNTARPEIRLALRHATSDDLNDLGLEKQGSIDPTLPYACLVLSDSGDGIPAELAKSVFAPYFTTKAKHGTGLGLSIVTNMVRAAGGAICLHTSKMGGAEFRIFLPLMADVAAPHVEGPAPTTKANALLADPCPPDGIEPSFQDIAPATNPKPLIGKAILVIDDNETVLDVWTAVLERAGAEVAPTSQPEDALEIFAEDPSAFDLVITDFDMGAISGADLARKIKDLRPNTPVVLITALTDWKSRDQAKANAPDPGFSKVLGKPVSTEVLVGTALSALGSIKY